MDAADRMRLQQLGKGLRSREPPANAGGVIHLPEKVGGARGSRLEGGA